ncbi:hypothetical protein QVD17_35718 [Tagetes erecta]|uniref:Uncharacterized protein n=1 Tax=Tagetes erecta TaxID=13708 RepID=A0AAD8JSP7_TARER|nr:hypothetical protein QVD17_35718 [Tagetes erecta]
MSTSTTDLLQPDNNKLKRLSNSEKMEQLLEAHKDGKKYKLASKIIAGYEKLKNMELDLDAKMDNRLYLSYTFFIGAVTV